MVRRFTKAPAPPVDYRGGRAALRTSLPDGSWRRQHPGRGQRIVGALPRERPDVIVTDERLAMSHVCRAMLRLALF